MPVEQATKPLPNRQWSNYPEFGKHNGYHQGRKISEYPMESPFLDNSDQVCRVERHRRQSRDYRRTNTEPYFHKAYFEHDDRSAQNLLEEIRDLQTYQNLNLKFKRRCNKHDRKKKVEDTIKGKFHQVDKALRSEKNITIGEDGVFNKEQSCTFKKMTKRIIRQIKEIKDEGLSISICDPDVVNRYVNVAVSAGEYKSVLDIAEELADLCSGREDGMLPGIKGVLNNIFECVILKNYAYVAYKKHPDKVLLDRLVLIFRQLDFKCLSWLDRSNRHFMLGQIGRLVFEKNELLEGVDLAKALKMCPYEDLKEDCDNDRAEWVRNYGSFDQQFCMESCIARSLITAWHNRLAWLVIAMGREIIQEDGRERGKAKEIRRNINDVRIKMDEIDDEIEPLLNLGRQWIDKDYLLCKIECLHIYERSEDKSYAINKLEKLKEIVDLIEFGGDGKMTAVKRISVYNTLANVKLDNDDLNGVGGIINSALELEECHKGVKSDKTHTLNLKFIVKLFSEKKFLTSQEIAGLRSMIVKTLDSVNYEGVKTVAAEGFMLLQDPDSAEVVLQSYKGLNKGTFHLRAFILNELNRFSEADSLFKKIRAMDHDTNTGYKTDLEQAVSIRTWLLCGYDTVKGKKIYLESKERKSLVKDALQLYCNSIRKAPHWRGSWAGLSHFLGDLHESGLLEFSKGRKFLPEELARCRNWRDACRKTVYIGKAPDPQEAARIQSGVQQAIPYESFKTVEDRGQRHPKRKSFRQYREKTNIP